MAVPVLIIGQSGSGKSRSLKNFKKGEVGVIKVIEKELPFRTDLSSITTRNYDEIKALLLKGKALSYFIDDAGYLLTTEFMEGRKTKGYEKFTDLAFNFYDLINFIQTALPREKIVYLVMHEDEDAMTGVVKPKTIGKLLDEKVCIEGLFTIVLRCVRENENHLFYVNNNAIAKSPEEMFEGDTIENDLTIVDKSIRAYWNLGGEN